MTFNVPILAGTGWIIGVFAVIAVVMVVKWIIDILP